MQGGRKLLKIIVLIDVVIVVYIILTSTIITINSENKAREAILESVLGWSTKSYNTYQYVVDRETDRFTKIDYDLAERLSGKFLIQTNSKGEVWYVSPEDMKKYFLGRPTEVYGIIKKLSTKITNDEMVNYQYFDKQFPEELVGRFVIDKDENKLYYISPDGKESHLLPNPQIVWSFVQENGLGINNENIRKIPVGELN